MDIKKTDSKGRISLGVPDTHYFVTSMNDTYRLEKVPVIEGKPAGYEYAEVSAAKDEVIERLREYIDEDEHDFLEIAADIVDTLLLRGVEIPEDFPHPKPIPFDSSQIASGR